MHRLCRTECTSAASNARSRSDGSTNADRYAAGRNHSRSSTGGNLMTAYSHEKVNAGHLKRNAYLYIRQSTLRQVLENTESTIRQYDLRQLAVALDWPTDRIMFIDSDLGTATQPALHP